MIHTLAVTKECTLKKDLPLEQLRGADIEWFWVDFDIPSEQEAKHLADFFHFHPLAIEDCLHFLQRPKVDYYEDYNFFVLHALNEKSLAPEEVDLFVGSNFIVSFHQTHLSEIDEVWLKINTSENTWLEGSMFICYTIIDKLVDHYFPSVYKAEDEINELDDNMTSKSMRSTMDKVFEIRSDLLKLRRVVIQMRDLLYRILNSNHLEDLRKQHIYFSDIYDHLLRLTEMIESSMAMTSEIRDSHISINSHHMNRIMMVLTVVTAIFIPLTFIVGIYGMNFKYMPELEWQYGYFAVMTLMALIAVIMFLWFKRKGWFDIDK